MQIRYLADFSTIFMNIVSQTIFDKDCLDYAIDYSQDSSAHFSAPNKCETETQQTIVKDKMARLLTSSRAQIRTMQL